MKVDVVVDVGNTRIKWGRCGDAGVIDSVSLSHEDSRAWQEQIEKWHFALPIHWAISGVHPSRRDQLADWLKQRGDVVHVFDSYEQLPIQVRVPIPNAVGIDRLLNAVAAKIGRATRCDLCIIIDAGSAVTVDVLDEAGAFIGGAIFPGLHLMAQALRDHTALLPLTDIREPTPTLPGDDTRSAIRAGVYWAVAGGIKALIQQLGVFRKNHRHAEVLITGGDAELLLPVLDPAVGHWPNMTLEGLRIAAEEKQP
jgi:type III pantothenate kinase